MHPITARRLPQQIPTGPVDHPAYVMCRSPSIVTVRFDSAGEMSARANPEDRED
jgi:hypothetical protein